MKKLEKWLDEYERTVKDIYRELVIDREELTPEEMSIEIDDLFYTRYGLGDKAAHLDKEYLPSIYEIISSKYPSFKERFLNSVKAAGVDLSIFKKTPV